MTAWRAEQGGGVRSSSTGAAPSSSQPFGVDEAGTELLRPTHAGEGELPPGGPGGRAQVLQLAPPVLWKAKLKEGVRYKKRRHAELEVDAAITIQAEWRRELATREAWRRRALAYFEPGAARVIQRFWRRYRNRKRTQAQVQAVEKQAEGKERIAKLRGARRKKPEEAQAASKPRLRRKPKSQT